MRDSEKTNCHHEGSNSMSQKGKLNTEEKVEIIKKYRKRPIRGCIEISGCCM